MSSLESFLMHLILGLICFSLVSSPFAAGADGRLLGNFTIGALHSTHIQPYPLVRGSRTTSTRSNALPPTCTVCEADAPTEKYFPKRNTLLKLSNNSVYGVNVRNGSVLTPSANIDQSCVPRYLHPLENHDTAAVVCHSACFQIVYPEGEGFGSKPLQCYSGGKEAIIDEEETGGVYLMILKDEGIDEKSLSDAAVNTDIIRDSDCTTFLSIHPVFEKNKFMFRCIAAGGIEKLFIVTRSQGSSSPYTHQSIPFTGIPISSPDGNSFFSRSGSTLSIYRTEDLMQYPGVKDFNVRIVSSIHLDGNVVRVEFDEENQVLVNVDLFIDATGTNGLTTLPNTASPSAVHTLVTYDVYATTNETGSLYNILLFNVSSGHSLPPLSNFRDQPLAVFFHQESHSVSPSAPLPKPIPVAPSLPSSLPTHLMSSSLPSILNPKPTVGLPASNKQVNHDILIGTSIPVFVVLLSALALFLVCVYCCCCGGNKCKKKRSYALADLNRQENGPEVIVHPPISGASAASITTKEQETSLGIGSMSSSSSVSGGSSLSITSSGSATTHLLPFPALVGPDSSNSCCHPLQESHEDKNFVPATEETGSTGVTYIQL